LSEVLVQPAGFAAADHGGRTDHRIGRNRNAAGQRFHHDQAQGVGTAGKHEAVGAGQMTHQSLSRLQSCEADARVARLEFGACRAVAHHILGSRQVEPQEVIEVFFRRDPAHVQENRPGAGQKGLVQRPEEIRIHTPPPEHQVAEPASAQFLDQFGVADHGACRAAVKPAHQRVAGTHGQERCPGLDILRKACVKRGREL
jgi:hypothetical protein